MLVTIRLGNPDLVKIGQKSEGNVHEDFSIFRCCCRLYQVVPKVLLSGEMLPGSCGSPGIYRHHACVSKCYLTLTLPLLFTPSGVIWNLTSIPLISPFLGLCMCIQKTCDYEICSRYCEGVSVLVYIFLERFVCGKLWIILVLEHYFEFFLLFAIPKCLTHV